MRGPRLVLQTIYVVKLRYYEKATKFEKISPLFWQKSCFYSVASKKVGDFFEFKIDIILYPWAWNSTTDIAIPSIAQEFLQTFNSVFVIIERCLKSSDSVFFKCCPGKCQFMFIGLQNTFITVPFFAHQK